MQAKNIKSKISMAALFVMATLSVYAQDSIKYRVIFIGDAGEINSQQNNVLTHAANNIIKGKTTVMYLGDNVYPHGFGLPGSPEEEQDKQILCNQFTPMRAKGAPTYFVPGNHDWDRMGKEGLAKIKQQWAFLESQHDSLLRLIPGNGCPDPVEINVGDDMVIIAYDSEWWLFPYNKANPDADCSCNTKKEVIEKMNELFYKNRYKVILLASHHPFQTYGHHGGHFSLKDHIFPLTAANDSLYIPLPVIGSLYPLLRTTFQSPEETVHPIYKDMIRQIDGVFSGFPNLVHVAGHEHGLQFIKSDQVQVVSGAGAKDAFVKKGKYALFAEEIGGYVTADLLQNNNVRFTYYTAKDSAMQQSFTYLQPFTDVKAMEVAAHVNGPKGDSIIVSAHAAFDSISSLHRTFFGENYRKEWAAPTTLPIIRISEIKGGLTPVQRGGGKQSTSLRLVDKNGKEWALRSVNKNPELVLPEPLRATFAKDLFVDNMSSQHPYSALVVPVIANAAGVPHANPIIGLVAPDTAFGIFEKDFANTVCLLEEREPGGKSDNSDKMFKELQKDNDNSFDSTTFLKARLLDLFIGDWDRHEDQWRWMPVKYGKGKRYIPVPRDRDQVMHVMEGIFPKAASRPWIAPWLHNFNGPIKRVNWFFMESNFFNKHFLNQFSYSEWMKITNDFVASMTDSVLETALQRLPESSYRIRHDVLLAKWKERRTNLPAAMSDYYRFVNKVVDIQTTDKNEFVSLTDATNNGLQVSISKISKDGEVKDLLYNRTFYHDTTREINFYLYKGDDSVYVNDNSNIKIRIIGKKGDKVYNVAESKRRIQLYGRETGITFTGNDGKLNKHLSEDSTNTAYVPTNPYNKVIPIIAAGYNNDDGILLGASVRFVNQGFRKRPYASMQQFSLLHAFSSDAFSFKFHSEWLEANGKADVLLNAKALAPDNTQNFFGLGNNTPFNKTGNYVRYYRTRFTIYQLDPALRWRMPKGSEISIGPSFQQYMFDAEDNIGRFINNVSQIHSYDSATVGNNKSFLGAIFSYTKDARNYKLLPTNGAYFSLKLQGYTGLSKYAESFAQATTEFAFYKSLDRQQRVIIANRLGGGVTVGKPAFYQALFLGGQENLLGYRQYRFAGENMLYNNFELRIKLAQVASYILPGQFGMVGFYDAGQVWAKGYNSNTVHQGVGGGFYFAPAQMAVFQIVAGYSQEGWYPYFTFGFRF